MKDSTAKVMRGNMEMAAANPTSKIERGILAPFSLTSEMFELLPVTVVKDFRLPTKSWFAARISVPITIMTPQALQLRHAPVADCTRYDSLRRAM